MFPRFKHPALPRHILLNVKKRGFLISALTELFIWIFLLVLVIYTYLPEIISLFGISDLEAPTRKPAFQGKQHKASDYRLELAMQLVLGNGEDIDTVLVDSLTSNHYVVPEEFRKTWINNTSELYELSNTTGSKDEEKNFLDTYIQSVQIKCSAPYPIQIQFEGSARPNFGKIRLEKRNIKVLEEMSQYFYIAILDFEKNLLEEVDSGKYICQPIPSSISTSQTETHLNDQVSINLFVPGEKVLIFEHIWDQRDVKNISSVVIHHSIAADGTEISLPCGVSDPSTKVTLQRITSSKKDLINQTILPEKPDYSVGIASSASYIQQNDVVGFTIPVSLVEDWPNINFICKAHQANGQLKEIPFEIKLKGVRNSQISPPNSEVTLSTGQLPTQVFKCTAEEPVMLKWLDGPTTQVSRKVFISGSEMYSVNFTGTSKQFIGNSTVARFECSRIRDGMVIHTWEWIKEEGGTKPFLRFNEKQRELSCCVKNSEPLILVQACSSMLECKLKASLQSKSTSSSWTKIIGNGEIKGQFVDHSLSGSNKDNSCAVWAIPNELQAGFIKCTEGGNNWNGDYYRTVELPPVYLRWNGDVVVFRDGHSSKPLDRLIRMKVTTSTGTDRSGNSYNYKKLECFASSMFFTKGLRWKIFTWSGEIFDNVQLKTLWENRNSALGIISYREKYLPKEGSYYGVLLVKTTNIIKPFLKIHSKENQLAHLELIEKIQQVRCEAALWNDTDMWIGSYFNKSMMF